MARMTHQESVDYSHLAGARMLLQSYDGWSLRIPDDPGQWQKQLFPLLRGIRNAEAEGGATFTRSQRNYVWRQTSSSGLPMVPTRR